MGNSLGGKKTAKVMKINGETLRFKTPVQAREVVKESPGYVLLESEAVKHFGIRAKPLEPCQELKPKRLYFLVELPKFREEKGPRRVRSGINMSAKDRLESLMLSRRSTSDLSIMKSPSIASEERSESGAVRLKMRLPKAEVDKLMAESKDEAEAAKRIVNLFRSNKEADNNHCVGGVGGAPLYNGGDGSLMHWTKGGRGLRKVGEKRVGFLPVTQGEIQVAVS